MPQEDEIVVKPLKCLCPSLLSIHRALVVVLQPLQTDHKQASWWCKTHIVRAHGRQVRENQ
jgi:hypothetical protein